MGKVVHIYVIDKATGKEIKLRDLALKYSKEGYHIVYCDLEGVATIKKEDGSIDHYIIDECGNSVYIEKERYDVIEE